MTSTHPGWGRLALVAGLLSASHAFAAEPLTADRAVQIALKQSTQAVLAAANVLDARGGVYSAYSGVLPHLSATYTRGGNWVQNQTGTETFGSVQTPGGYDSETFSTTPGLAGTWAVLDLSALKGLSSAKHGLKAAKLSEASTRNDIARAVRGQFYTVVRAIQLTRVNNEALQLSRDDERRVRALFEVGSVSKSDVLKAQVATAQSELDSLTASHQVSTTRIDLATLLGVAERELGDIDTTLTVSSTEYNEAELQTMAAKNRPDLMAAEAELKSASSGRTSARLARLPFVTLSGTAAYQPTTSTKVTTDVATSTRSESDRTYRAAVALNWDFFDGLATDARNAQTEARLWRARDNRDALRRNLEAEVRQALLTYNESLESWNVARRAVESADENLKLTREKYNVGSSTILDLVDAQVQLQRAQNQDVTAKALIRVAEAGIRRATGQAD